MYKPSTDHNGWIRIFEWDPYYNLITFNLTCTRSYMSGPPMCYKVHVSLNATSNYISCSLISISYESMIGIGSPQAYQIRVSTDSEAHKQGLDVFIERPDESALTDTQDIFTFTLDSFSCVEVREIIWNSVKAVDKVVNDFSGTTTTVYNVLNATSQGLDSFFRNSIFTLGSKGNGNLGSGRRFFITPSFIDGSNKFVIRFTSNAPWTMVTFLLFDCGNIIAYGIAANGTALSSSYQIDTVKRTNLATFFNSGPQKNINNFTEVFGENKAYLDIKNANISDQAMIFGYHAGNIKIELVPWYDDPTT